MNYTLNQIRVYLKIVETESITKAAEELYMTQPAVSIQLKNFQDQFEVPLTELIGRKLHITEFGYEIAEIAEKAFLELENLRFKTLEFKGLLSGKLKISSASTGKYVIPFFLSEFLQTAPGINLVLDVTNKSRVLESLKQNEIDFAIVSVIPKDLEVEEEKLVENKLFLVSDGKGNPKKKPLIFREEGSATRQEMERYFQQHGSKDRKKLELTSNEAVKQAVVAGLGNSIVPLIGIKNELLNQSIHIVPRRGLPLKTDWRLIWLKSKRLSPVAQAYLDYIREHKEEIIEKHFKWYEDFEGEIS
ncbi:LysR family transcriptional regulator [Croceimicrobium hydrocarbonivorans]|uniref:LysR family transcriptional regulator n=1 Tax=Croceimicrobium hydrocarbonivorans TaxID=2761580 RepID=A0A7H0VFU8_9FLAO|nr:LysR family transcriptional regulator [Croceimicrobium hydrocarbonivorans]QNR24596.1 LysR family transcriptional regulator [Croceimicrobium hydrocarbonivorans]